MAESRLAQRSASGSDTPPSDEPRLDALQQSAIAAGVQPPRARNSNAIYGYHNTFHLHALPELPPTHPPPAYHARPQALLAHGRDETLPPYKCTVQIMSQIAVKSELSSPFSLLALPSPIWQDVFAAVNGTQFLVYGLKVPGHRSILGKVREPVPGKLIRAYSLQHAEVGLATDVKKSELVPRRGLSRLIPPHSRQKVYETDPHLFEPVREFILRIRVEAEQFLICAKSQEEMLDWVEALSMAIDISMPLECRSEPRYRSLPRRARRQRELDGRTSLEVRISGIESRPGLIAQQERIIRELFPHLATNDSAEASEEREGVQSVQDLAQADFGASNLNSDPDAEDLDREDALVPTSSQPPTPNERPRTGVNAQSSSGGSYFPTVSSDPPRRTRPRATSASEAIAGSSTTMAHSDELSLIADLLWATSGPRLEMPVQRAPSKPQYSPTPQLRPHAALRYRKRCAPILLASSPRASDIIVAPKSPLTPYKRGATDRDRGAGADMQRLRLDFRKHKTAPFETLPPKYEAHTFIASPSRLSELLPDASTVLETSDVADFAVQEDGHTESIQLQADSQRLPGTTAVTTAAARTMEGTEVSSQMPYVTDLALSRTHSETYQPQMNSLGQIRTVSTFDGSQDDLITPVTSTTMQRDSSSCGSSSMEETPLSSPRQHGSRLTKTLTSDSQSSVKDPKELMRQRRQTFQAKFGKPAAKAAADDGVDAHKRTISVPLARMARNEKSTSSHTSSVTYQTMLF